MRQVALGLALAALIGATQAQAAADCRRIAVYSAPCFSQIKPRAGCPAIPRAKAPCFDVRGVIQPANGTPSLRIHWLGTRRVLGVLGGDGDADSPALLPPALRAAMTPSSPGDLNSVTAAFRVCPLAAERAGWMQPVCIASARRMTVVPASQPNEPLPTPAGQAGSRSRPAPG